MKLLCGVRSGSDMTQNTTRNDKREQCDTKHNNTIKIYLAGENIFRILFLQPTRQQVFRVILNYLFLCLAYAGCVPGVRRVCARLGTNRFCVSA